jgi:uncharacterized NAD(P)/FAD-binding protein YdhS
MTGKALGDNGKLIAPAVAAARIVERPESPPFELVIIGAGPRAICLLERISANAPELLECRSMVVHLVDPFPPGSGRIWRADQSPLLRMNSRPDQVTMFPGASVTMAGPMRLGPSLREWAELIRHGELLVPLDGQLRAEVAAMSASSFVTRRLQGAYLEWVYREILATLPTGLSVREHRTRATKLTEDGAQQVWLADSTVPLRADAVVLSVGHGDGVPLEHTRFEEEAARCDLSYYPPSHTADYDYGDIPAGETVVLRGMGLAFVDLMSLLTEGRGGEFQEQPDGTLKYLPSGAEPVFYAGSRRGVPYRAKILYSPLGEKPFVPRFFSSQVIESLINQPNRLEFFSDVWPHIAKELSWGYYTELFTGHPERVQGDFLAFSDAFEKLSLYSKEMRALIEAFVPAREDRLDIENLNRPLAGLSFPGVKEVDQYVGDYLEDDLARSSNPYFSADLGLNMAMAAIINHLPLLLSWGRLDSISQLSHVDSWWHNFYSYVSSGPPPRRLRELIALRKAGVVRFLGAELQVEIDRSQRFFVAKTETSPERVPAKILVDARLPVPDLRSTSDPLLRNLWHIGAISEEASSGIGQSSLSSGRILVRHSDSRVVESSGRAHSARFALGPNASDRLPSSFTKPHIDAPCFRQNDLVAREILTLVTNFVSEEVPLGLC